MELLHPKFLESLVVLQNFFEFYYEILSMTDIHEDKDGELMKVIMAESHGRPTRAPTLGVKTTKHGFVMVYDKKYLESVGVQELTADLIHEVNHLLLKHQDRTGQRKKSTVNIVTDMIINDIIERKIPKKHAELGEGSLYIPKEFHGEAYMEEMYEWIMDTNPKNGNSKMKEQEQDGDGESGDGKGKSKKQDKQDKEEKEKQKGNGSGNGQDEQDGDQDQEGQQQEQKQKGNGSGN